MSDKVSIYGHEIELAATEDGCVITDVIILARQMNPGDLDDDICVSATANTSPIVSTGILHVANHLSTQLWERWAANQDDEEDE